LQSIRALNLIINAHLNAHPFTIISQHNVISDADTNTFANADALADAVVNVHIDADADADADAFYHHQFRFYWLSGCD